MQRQQAVSKASKFLGRKQDIKTGSTAKKIKDRAKGNPDLNRAALNQIVADIFQRGANPKDLDLQRIDWSVSYSNIRSQIADLLDKRGVSKFESTKERERESMQSYAAEKESDQLMTIAEVRHERRPSYNQYVDEVKEAQKKFGRLTDSAFKKWARNPNKYDIEGIDGKEEKGDQVPLPFQRNDSNRIKDMMMNEIELDTSDPVEVPNRNIAAEEKELRVSESDKLDFMDSRSSKDVEKNVKGTTSERSTQSNLRDEGVVSKSSEKTLDNFQDSVEKGGKKVSEKFDGNYV